MYDAAISAPVWVSRTVMVALSNARLLANGARCRCSLREPLTISAADRTV